MIASVWARGHAALVLLVALLAPQSGADAGFAQQGSKLVGAGATNSASQGYAVALSRDGNTAVVGGPDDAVLGMGRAGAVWFFTRSNGTWSAQGGKVTATGTSGSIGTYLGTSVALSADGNTALVGGHADGNDNGAVWVFTRSGGTWSQSAKLTPNDATAAAKFGFSVSLSDDGTRAVIGGPFDNFQNSAEGAAWIFVNNGGTWSQVGDKLVDTGAANSQQGYGVAMSGDGNTALVAGSNDNSASGSIWVYVRDSGTGNWSQQGDKLAPTDPGVEDLLGFRASLALSFDGNTALAGGGSNGGNPGGAWVWTRSGTTWTQQGSKLFPNDMAAPGDPVGFGFSAALSADGNTAVISAPNEGNLGATWAFTRSQGTWSQQGAKLVGTPNNNFARQGESVAVSGDGNTLIAGSPIDGANGAAFVFVQTPTVTAIAPNSGTTLGGTSVTITGTGFGGVDAISQGVTIGGNAATSVTVVDPTHITAVTAAHAAGAVDVVVTNSIDSGTGAGLYTYVLPAPEVTSVSPNKGPAAGGTNVVITGTNFTGATAVKFGGTDATSFTVDNATHISATTPAHAAGSVAVAVTTSGGTGSTSGAYQYFPAPVVTGLSPNNGYGGQQATVIVTGTGFTNVGGVLFNLSNVIDFTVNSPTKITVILSAQPAGTVGHIRVNTQGGNSATSAASKFTYIASPTTTSLYKFKGGTTDGATPAGWLIADAAGKLYGVTTDGGPTNNGSVFMLTPPTSPSTVWKRTVLHFFNGTNGENPVAGLFLGTGGQLYGTTPGGGASQSGTVFRLKPPASGNKWTHEVLYSFTGDADGDVPLGGVVVAKNGQVFGATQDGAELGKGVLFRLTPAATLPWTKKTMHTFSGMPAPASVRGRLRIDADGVIWGTSTLGGKTDKGSVFKYRPPAGNTLPKPVVLFSFKGGNDGRQPAFGGLALDADGNIFGTTEFGGANSVGTVFKLAPKPPANTTYTESVLQALDTPTGYGPLYGVSLGKNGSLIGTTSTNGPGGNGTVYKLVPPAGGQSGWTARVMRAFANNDPMGEQPNSDLLIRNNVIYGFTVEGGVGACKCGVVFMIKE